MSSICSCTRTVEKMGGKYFTRAVQYNGIRFDSSKELERYMVLKYKEEKGEISDLRLQVRFEILPQIKRMVCKDYVTRKRRMHKVVVKWMVDEKAKHYTCDFMYTEGDRTIIEEVKSKGTKLARDYPLRKHLIKMWIQKENEAAGCERYEFREVL